MLHSATVDGGLTRTSVTILNASKQWPSGQRTFQRLLELSTGSHLKAGQDWEVSASQGSPNVAHSSAHCTWDARSQGLGTEQAVHVLNFLCSPGDSLGPLEAGSLLRLYPVLDTRKPHGRCEIKVLEKCSYGLAAGAALEWGPCVKKGLHEAPASTA